MVNVGHKTLINSIPRFCLTYLFSWNLKCLTWNEGFLVYVDLVFYIHKYIPSNGLCMYVKVICIVFLLFCIKVLYLVLTIFLTRGIFDEGQSSIKGPRYNLVRLWDHARIRSWNQPVLNNKGEVSCSRK